MPRDGSGNYTYPPGTPGIPDTTIESAKYNGYIADIQQDLNLPRPIVAGGTGATNATAARDNLDAEVAGTQVLNYDTHVFEAGSFWSLAGATAAPTAGGVFTGICYQAVPHRYIEARDVLDTGNPPKKYIRRFLSPTWSAWMIADTITSSGGTMGGDLSLNYAEPTLYLDKPVGAHSNTIAGRVAGFNRWTINLGDNVNDPGVGANVGSHFRINRFSDNGVYVDTPLNIGRSTGMTTTNDLTVNGTITVTNNLQFGTAAVSGVAGDGTNVTVRSYSNNNIYFQALSPSPANMMNISTQGLTISGIGSNWAVINLNATSPAGSGIAGSQGGVRKWALNLGNTTGANDFSLDRYNDAGVVQVSSILINRTTGLFALTVAGATAPTQPTAMNFGYVGGAGQYGISLRPATGGTSSYPIAIVNAANAVVGSVSHTDTVTTYNTSSDERLKEDLKSFDAGNIVDDTNVYDFKWRSTGERAYGVIAQQAINVYPAAITHNEKDDLWFVDYSKYVPVLLQELKALRARVAELEGRLDAKPA